MWYGRPAKAQTSSLIRAFTSHLNNLYCSATVGTAFGVSKLIIKNCSYKEAALARLSLFMSKCHIVGNHMMRLICVIFQV